VVTTDAGAGPRTPLTKERVLRAAVELADRGGFETLSMRKLGQELGVEAMALYRHVASKDDLLDGVVQVVVGEIALHAPSGAWQGQLRRQIMGARAVMLRHPWAPRLLEERKSAGPVILDYIESVLAILRAGGFSLAVAHHALHVLGSRILGFTQDLFEDAAGGDPGPEATALMSRAMAGRYPNVTDLALAATHDGALGACDDDEEFAIGLDLILDGLERLRTAAPR
jgi:AcrR family transcriptional regulator